MIGISIPVIKYKVLVIGCGDETGPKEVEIESIYSPRINHTGDLVFTDNISWEYPSLVAAFSSGSWVSFRRE